MRFRSAHKLIAYLLAGLGMMSLALGGTLHPAILLLVLLAGIGSWWAEEPLVSRPQYMRLWTSALVVVLGIQVARIIATGNLIERGIEFALLLQLNRLWNRRGARDYQQIVILALIQLIASCVLDQDVSFVFVYAAFVVALPWAMTLGHLRREIEGNYQRSEAASKQAHVMRILNSRRIVTPRFLGVTAALALPIFVMSGALFVIFPRLGLGFLAGAPRQRVSVAGFSDRVQLGDVGVIRDDHTVVMRVEMEPTPTPPPARLQTYWRGAAYDYYTGIEWRRTPAIDQREPLDRIGSRYCLSLRCRVRGPRTVYRVYLEDLDPPVLLLPPGAQTIVMAPQRDGPYLEYRTLYRSLLHEVRREAEPTLFIHYKVEVPAEPTANLEESHPLLSPYLQVPDLDPRVAQLAAEVTAQAGRHPLRMADAVAAFLRSSFRYSRDLRGTSDERPLEDFLLRRRAGHCEFFSTAMAILLRTRGVPTRNVTGFLGGRLNPFSEQGHYVVTQSDAHSWVEVYAPGVGWVAYDPTPPASSALPDDRQSLLVLLRELVDASRLAWEKTSSLTTCTISWSSSMPAISGIADCVMPGSPKTCPLRGTGKRQPPHAGQDGSLCWSERACWCSWE